MEDDASCDLRMGFSSQTTGPFAGNLGHFHQNAPAGIPEWAYSIQAAGWRSTLIAAKNARVRTTKQSLDERVPSTPRLPVALFIFGLLLAAAGTARGQQGAPERPPSRLRAPWTDRARDLGILAPESIRVVSDGARSDALRLHERVVRLRALFKEAFGSHELRRPDAPKLLVFEDLGEMRFTLRTVLGAPSPDAAAFAYQHPDGTLLAVTTQAGSPLSSERAFQAEALRQYILPRFPEAFPPWAEFGLAECAGALLISGDSLEANHVPPIFARDLLAAERDGRLIPLDRLIRLDEELWSALAGTASSARLLRAQAWSLVHFMLSGGSPELSRRFKLWLAKVAAGEAPVEAFERVLQSSPGGATIGGLERAWRAWIRELAPSPVLASLERAELLRAVFEELEREGIRPSTPDAFARLVTVRPALEHRLLAHPYEYVLDSRDPAMIDPARLEFLPVRTLPRVRNEADSDSPPRIRLGETGTWSIEIEWDWTRELGRWVPRIVATPE